MPRNALAVRSIPALLVAAGCSAVALADVTLSGSAHSVIARAMATDATGATPTFEHEGTPPIVPGGSALATVSSPAAKWTATGRARVGSASTFGGGGGGGPPTLLSFSGDGSASALVVDEIGAAGSGITSANGRYSQTFTAPTGTRISIDGFVMAAGMDPLVECFFRLSPAGPGPAILTHTTTGGTVFFGEEVSLGPGSYTIVASAFAHGIGSHVPPGVPPTGSDAAFGFTVTFVPGPGAAALLIAAGGGLNARRRRA
ncbi:MAG: hypothetical protein ACKVS8_09265 [Phycisphaerales bacterium]